MKVRLNKEGIIALLENRFANERIKKLRDIPTPETFSDMDKAVNRTLKAIKGSELITIVGDYDVDGVVSSVIIKEFLEKVGARFEVVIPHRIADGYGLSTSVLKKINGSLVITVDNGITAVESARELKIHGKELIITDHHLPQDELPEALAIVNPKKQNCDFPAKDICGAQVTWYFCAALKQTLGVDVDMGGFLELLTLSVFSDAMPLLEANRVIAKSGFERLKTSSRPAFSVYRQLFGDFDHYENLTFSLIPLLNAAGRIGSAMIAFRFLVAKDRQEANFFLQQLITLNERRKQTEREIFYEAMEMYDGDSPVVIAHQNGWHEGVVGIVSSKLMQEFNKPSIVFSIRDGIAKGSARSVEGVDIFSEILKHKEMLIHFGGHKKAAGLSLDENRIEAFKHDLCASFEQSSEEAEAVYDGFLDAIEVDMALAETLKYFEPYGEGNERLRFRGEVFVKSYRTVGKDKNTKMLEVQNGEESFKAFIFNAKNTKISSNTKIDCIYEVDLSSYKGKKKPKLLISRVL